MTSLVVAWFRALLSPRRCSRCLICTDFATRATTPEGCATCGHLLGAHEPRWTR